LKVDNKQFGTLVKLILEAMPAGAKLAQAQSETLSSPQNLDTRPT
jgi:hypothetical protein